jgi:hypothetical protein
MEWMAAISGDHVGLFLDFSSRRKILGNRLPRQKQMIFIKLVDHLWRKEPTYFSCKMGGLPVMLMFVVDGVDCRD